ncbi:triacylglycerol lipase [Paecilomyces variotii No. 5]|uniref:Carboxylic ester hydrolase n=1 Tax=Byssochlamys spectabilis (strain No. 5 / NBRC 109023) TaxID=1356009 RepID=V5FSK0_BYSSN|nr:triacylglycerol lipase [Paecilomyces variotii No. 5]
MAVRALPLLLLSACYCLLSSFAAAQDTLVDLGYAKYHGQAFSNGISRWLGIRYAAPPVGDLRFAAPQDPVASGKTVNATQHGPVCISTSTYPTPSDMSEDCLFLDVYAPSNAKKSSEKLPVYFFIQGGGFNALSNANYNGAGLLQASNLSIVIVTFNYRVGPYGFLAAKEIEEGASLNNGLKDQIKALQWVQKYISKFGGDPNHVVIGGPSAGGGSVTLLLSAYGGRDDGLFHAAVAESQSFAGMFDVEGSQFAYDNLVDRTGCTDSKDTLACLRKLDTNSLQKQNIMTPFPGAKIAPLYMYGPTVDNDLVPDYTYALFEQGRFIKVPVIFGDDTNEGTIFVPKSTSSIEDADTFIQAQFPKIRSSELSTINSIYMGPNSTRDFPDSGAYWPPASTAYGEIRYICPGIYLSDIYAKHGVPSWNYHYAVEDPSSQESGYGVTHTVEVNAIWGPQYVSGAPPASYTTSNAPIVPVMQGYWTSFIRSFDPNPHRAAGSPMWTTWTEGLLSYQRIFIRTGDTKMETVYKAQRERCSYLTSIGLDLKQK